MFQVEGDKLFGTASFLGFKRGIEDGRIDGDKISFNVRFHEALEGMSTERTNRYTGVLSGGEIHFRMQDDKGSPPIEFIVSAPGTYNLEVRALQGGSWGTATLTVSPAS